MPPFRFPAGNKFIHELTSIAPQLLRFELHFSDDSYAYANYHKFNISDESDGFRWHVAETFDGDAGNYQLCEIHT